MLACPRLLARGPRSVGILDLRALALVGHNARWPRFQNVAAFARMRVTADCPHSGECGYSVGGTRASIASSVTDQPQATLYAPASRTIPRVLAAAVLAA